VTSRSFPARPVTNGTVSFASTYAALLAALPGTGVPLTVLDLACGDGHLLGLLAEAPAAHTLIGVDLSRGELKAARARLGERVALYRAKAQQLPLATGSIDVVTCHLALMLMDEADAVCTELRRVLRLGGTVAGVVGARPPPSPELDAFTRLYPATSQRAEFAGIRFGDRRFRSADGIAEWLAPRFEAPHFETLTSTCDCTPAQLWEALGDMYDTDLLTPVALADFQSDYLDALQPLCGPTGTLAYTDRYQLFTAKVPA
jgi:SAM-dependent methyltransferase